MTLFEFAERVSAVAKHYDYFSPDIPREDMPQARMVGAEIDACLKEEEENEL